MAVADRPGSPSAYAARSSQRRCVASAPSPSSAGCRDPSSTRRSRRSWPAAFAHRVHVRLGGRRRRHRALAGDGRAAVGAGTIRHAGPGGCGRRGRRPVPRRADVSGGRGRASARARRAVRSRRAVADRDRHRVAAGCDVREAVPGRRCRRRLPARRAHPLKDVEILVTGGSMRRARGRSSTRAPRRSGSRPPSSASPPRRTATSERSKRGARAARRRRLILARRRRATGRAHAWRARHDLPLDLRCCWCRAPRNSDA